MELPRRPAAPSEDMSSHRRAQPRVQANLSVKVRLPEGATTRSELIRNISLGGVFIQMEEPLAFGTEVALEFSLPGAPGTIRCKGFVVWSTRTSPERAVEGMSGVGVRLMDIGITEMRALADYVEAELTG